MGLFRDYLGSYLGGYIGGYFAVTYGLYKRLLRDFLI
jgi:hypothetical protein